MAASEGVDLEWCIVEKIRVKNGEQKKFTKTYSKNILDQADKCVKHLEDYASGKQIKIWHSDETSGPYGSISAKPEPKTDIVAKIGTKTHTISVKMEGPVQLASGQGASSAELFRSAAKHMTSIQDKRVLDSIIKELTAMPTRLLSSANKKRVEKESSAKVIEEFIKGGKIIQSKDYEYWIQNNKEVLLNSMLDYIESDDDFQTALLYEALTGEYSLAQYRGAVADSIISPKGFYEIDGAYVDSIKRNVKFDVRGKSRSGITSLAFRIDLKQ